MASERNFTISERYELCLFGPATLFDWAGQSLTPKAKKTQGLLAILAVAKGAPVSRATLQDRLWSDRMQTQGRDSLRHALQELRQVFSADDRPILEIDGDRVTLNPRFFRCDIFEGRQHGDVGCRPEFLEGCDIRDPVFQDWVREIRSWLDGHTLDATVGASPSEPLVTLRLRIGFDEVAQMKGDPRTAFAVRMLIERMSRHLLAQGVFEISAPDTDPGRTAAAADVCISVTAMRSDSEVTACLSIRSVNFARIIAGFELTVDLASMMGEAGQTRTAQLCDQIIERLFHAEVQQSRDRFQTTRLVLTGIDRLFRISNPDIELAEEAFRTAVELEPNGAALAWLAYLRAFKYEKSLRRKRGEGWDDYRDLAARAISLDPHNPLVAALLANVYGFVGRDYERSQQILEPFTGMKSDNAMVQDALAMLRYYTGDFQMAERHANRAVQLGRQNPYRFFFTTSQAMIALVQGKSADAIRYGEAALAQHPLPNAHFFEPTLRTLLGAYANSDNLSDARRILGLIRKQDPNFTAKSLENHETAPIPNPLAFDIIRSGARKAEEDDGN